jgi:hypothetical protein
VNLIIFAFRRMYVELGHRLARVLSPRTGANADFAFNEDQIGLCFTPISNSLHSDHECI